MFGFNQKKKSNGRQKSKNGRTPSDHLIELRDVVKTYHSAAGDFTALKDVELQIDGGEFVAVIGKSGSGKSTLINMITGIDRPSGGEVLIGNVPVHRLSEGKLAEWRGRNVGVIFQFFQLLPTLTAIENVMLPMDFCDMYGRRERKERALFLLEQVDLVDQAYKLPSALSGGQQQRVAIARALANDPPILVADEPTGNLDSKTAESVFRLFENLVEQGKTILMVTHDQDLAERVTRTVIISDGEIIEEYLAETFPSLTTEQLVQATRHLQLRRVAPGAVIIEEGAPADNLYIVTKGQVDVHITTSNGQEFIVAHMKEGQYVGEIELLRGGNSIATVRASASEGAEVAALARDEFVRLLEESEPTRSEVEQVVQERLAENVAGREGRS